ncbi:CLUMA_CG011137, isoform A [Clunio marinus]|uniref:CLUMA_CG011137, isoform A n=1 Tax=Clunio marinus TaxID=568069 RepID=A0A1J1IBV4_9DIPT|nr:CLUMA_CG011137, isoform A [Clunio marinus]
MCHGKESRLIIISQAIWGCDLCEESIFNILILKAYLHDVCVEVFLFAFRHVNVCTRRTARELDLT